MFVSNFRKNQLFDFQAFTINKLRVLLRSEREHERLSNDIPAKNHYKCP